MPSTPLDALRYSIELQIGEDTERLPVLFTRRRRARRMVIRYQPLKHVVSVTLPLKASIRQGLHFVEDKRRWIAAQVSERARHVPFADGQQIPLSGRMHTLCHAGGRGVVRVEEGVILVPGEERFMARRLRDWLRTEALRAVTPLAQAKAQILGKRVRRISVRDTSSRWGSCSHDGRLSFSWRLVLAPPEVLDYVVCHEVAHLKEHNHSPAFWAAVEKLCPHHLSARAWLRSEGMTLYRYG